MINLLFNDSIFQIIVLLLLLLLINVFFSIGLGIMYYVSIIETFSYCVIGVASYTVHVLLQISFNTSFIFSSLEIFLGSYIFNLCWVHLLFSLPFLSFFSLKQNKNILNR